MKSLGYYNYTGTQTVTSGSTLPLTTTVRQYGNNIRLSNNSVIIQSTCNSPCTGYYNVYVNATLTASAAGTITVSLYQDGQLVQGAMQSQTVANADITNFSFTAPIRVFCGQSNSTLVLYVNGQSVSTMSISLEVVRE